MRPAAEAASDLARPEKDVEAFWRWRAAHEGTAAEEAREYVRRLGREVGPLATAVVLDFGGGLGFVARALAPTVAAVWVWDASPSMRAGAIGRLAPLPNARSASVAELTAPAPPRRYDLVLVNSVVQYMTAGELGAWLGVWRRLLRPAGRIVLSDLLPPGHSLAWDLLDQLAFGARGGFLGRAVLAGLAEIRPFLAQRHALTRLAPGDLRRRATAAGLETRLLPHNLTHRRRRFAAILSAGGVDRAASR